MAAALSASGLEPHRPELEIQEAVLLREFNIRARHLEGIARARRAIVDGQFRRRLFVAEFAEQLRVRSRQDRPQLHSRDRSRQ
ncbi:MAG: hypothetical protein MZV49_25960 [Rhodopseudomonas palustris]|nr:hypothetical protein [Rhodopseudomonas palustris]